MVLSSAEQRMAQYVADVPDAPVQETPEEKNARINRNWEEIKRARINALKARDPKAVGVLDQELAKGRGTDFPNDAFVPDNLSDDGFVADDGFVPDAAPRPTKSASQADVRKSEPSMAMIEQEAAERGWGNYVKEDIRSGEAARRRTRNWRGDNPQTQAEAISAKTGMRNPAETRQAAEAQHAIDTGELIYGDSALYNVAKPAAAIGGFALGGPAGATLADALTRGIAVGYNIDKALDKGMPKEQAAEIIAREMTTGIATDAGFNFLLPVVGQLLMKIPGLKRIGDKITEKLVSMGATPKPRAELRDAKLADRKELTDNPARKQAVDELAARTEGDRIPTQGQVAGKSGFWEKRAVEAFPGEFEEGEAALGKAAEQLRKETVSPNSQPTQQALGEQIDRFVESTVKATKDRLRPVFEAANDGKMIVDMKPVVDIARDALRKNSAVMGKGKLTDAEVAHLKSIIEGYKMQPWRGAEPTLDFLSVQKDMLRKLNPDGQPSKYFSIIVGDMEKAAKGSFDEGARRMGQTGLVQSLEAAWKDYRTMNESAYTGAMKNVLKKGEDSAEDIGSYLWAPGKVSRIDDLDEMLNLGGREGVASQQAIDKLRRNVARGFLQQGVQNVDDAAKWSISLEDPKRKATWEALTRTPAGQQLKQSMEMLEQAAQIASTKPTNQKSKFMNVAVSRAIGGGLGFSWVTGAISPVIAGVGLSVAGTVRLMATAFTHGDAGTINLLNKVIRSNSTATAASAKALEALLPQLAEAAKKYDVDPFIRDAEDVGNRAYNAANDPLNIRKTVTNMGSGGAK